MGYLEPTFAAIQQALHEGVTERRTSVGAIAARLHSSPSTVHRRLRRHHTTFAVERNTVRAQQAFELLTAGYPASIAAARVGVSTDHLCVVMRRAYGVTPRRIRQIVRLAGALRAQPETREQLAQFERNDAQLQVLLDPIGPGHPLAGWAKKLVVLGHRPEYYEPGFLLSLREREARQRIGQQHAADAERVAGLTEQECRATPIDVNYLLFKRDQERQNMRWRRRQLRDARRRVAAYARPTTRTR